MFDKLQSRFEKILDESPTFFYAGVLLMLFVYEMWTKAEKKKGALSRAVVD